MATVVTIVEATARNYSGNYSEDYFARIRQLRALGDNVLTYGLPLIIIGGTVGNVLSIATLCSKYFRHAPCTVLLLALAVVDTLLLTFTGTDYWHYVKFGFDWKSLVKPSTGLVIDCIQNTLFSLSPWTIVLITFERFVCVMWPFRAGTICSRKRMAVSWGIMALVILLSWSCAEYFLCFNKNNDDSADQEDILSTLYRWFIFISISGVPFLLIAGGNAGIIYKTFVAYRRKQKTLVSSSSSTASAASQARALTTMLVAVCTVFLLTTFPLQALHLIMLNIDLEDRALVAQLYLLWDCLLLLFFINNATNFILYFFSGTQFRKAFLKLIRGCKQHRSPCHNL